MKTKNQNFLGLVAAIALVFNLASVGAAEAKPQRPPRPEMPPPSANVTELKQIVKEFQAQKKEFLQQVKEQHAGARGKVREELSSSGTTEAVKDEAKDSLAEAKRISREQARKLAEEAKEAAKEGRKRD